MKVLRFHVGHTALHCVHLSLKTNQKYKKIEVILLLVAREVVSHVIRGGMQ